MEKSRGKTAPKRESGPLFWSELPQQRPSLKFPGRLLFITIWKYSEISGAIFDQWSCRDDVTLEQHVENPTSFDGIQLFNASDERSPGC